MDLGSGNAARNIMSIAKDELKANGYVSSIWRKLRGEKIPSFMVVLEQPSASEIIAEKVVIRGWALSMTGKKVRGDILLNNEVVAPLEFVVQRPDVAEAFGISSKQQSVGFDQVLLWKEVCGDALQADLSIRLFHGSEVTILGPVVLSHTASPYVVHQRGSYKEVWNSASTNHKDAMTSVAGFSNYDDFMDSGKSSTDTFCQALGITSSDIVLEIGCGTGRVGASMASRCKQWIGSDISGNMLSYARDNLRRYSNVDFVELSGCNLKPFADNSIDKIYCTAVFMHLDPWERYRYIQEAHRALKNGGKLYVDNLNLAGDTAWKIFEELAALDPAKRPPHVSKHSTSDELVAYLKRAGFKDIKTYPGAHMVAAVGKKD